MKRDKLRNKLLKLSYGISGPIDEYQERELDRLGNSGYLVLTAITPFILFVSVVLALIASYKVAFWFAVISLFALFIIVTWYFYIVAIRQKILVNEVRSTDLKAKRKTAVKRGIITGIIFALIELVAQIVIYQRYAIEWNAMTVAIPLLAAVFVGAFAGLLNWLITRKNIKKFDRE